MAKKKAPDARHVKPDEAYLGGTPSDEGEAQSRSGAGQMDFLRSHQVWLWKQIGLQRLYMNQYSPPKTAENIYRLFRRRWRN
jgi:hypothetical protein